MNGPVGTAIDGTSDGTITDGADGIVNKGIDSDGKEGIIIDGIVTNGDTATVDMFIPGTTNGAGRITGGSATVGSIPRATILPAVAGPSTRMLPGETTIGLNWPGWCWVSSFQRNMDLKTLKEDVPMSRLKLSVQVQLASVAM